MLEKVNICIKGKNGCIRMTSAAGDLAVCTHLTAPCTAQVTGCCQRSLCCFVFTDIQSLFLSFPLLDLRLGWFRLLVQQMLELC